MHKRNAFCLTSAMALAAAPLSAQTVDGHEPVATQATDTETAKAGVTEAAGRLVSFDKDIFIDYDHGVVLGKSLSNRMDLILRFKKTGQGKEYRRDPYRVFNRSGRQEYTVGLRYRF